MIYTARVTKLPVDSGTKAKRHCAGTCKRKKALARARVTHPLTLGCVPLAAAAPPRSERGDPWPSPRSFIPERVCVAWRVVGFVAWCVVEDIRVVEYYFVPLFVAEEFSILF